MLSPATLEHPTQPSQYAAQPVPSLKDFQSLWTAWDVVTKTMVPREDLLSKPIKLRNELIFYLGHIPTFFGMPVHAFKFTPHTNSGRYSYDSSFARKAN